ncbi:MAG TPA: PAS domain-containing protein, partial [Leptospiraceae bacterium]|nr:PAS domain-containing protein [Leptospiraceae bacterium]
SVNEELHTVNSEYQNKIVELTELNYDIQNLLQTSQTAILFLDENLEVRRFTLKIKEIFNVIETDIGRSIRFISHSLQNIDLVTVTGNVAAKTEVFSKDVKSADGKWYQLKIFPYQISQNQFSGVLLHFTDITERIIHENQSSTFRDLFLLAENIGEMGYWEWSPDFDTFICTDGLIRILEINEKSFLEKYNDFINIIYPDDRTLFLQALDHAVKERKTFDIRHRIVTSKGKILTVSQIVRLKNNQTEKQDHICSLVKLEPDLKLEKFGIVTWR